MTFFFPILKKAVELRVGKPGLDFATEGITFGTSVSASVQPGKQLLLYFTRLRVSLAFLRVYSSPSPVHLPLCRDEKAANASPQPPRQPGGGLNICSPIYLDKTGIQNGVMREGGRLARALSAGVARQAGRL